MKFFAGKHLFVAYFLCTLGSISFAQYPYLGEMNSKNPIFRQFQDDLSQYYRAEANNAEYPSLSFYLIEADPGLDLLHLAARLNIAYDTIVSLNHLKSLELSSDAGVLMISNTPGLYVPCKPQSDLEFLMHSWRDLVQQPIIKIKSSLNQYEDFYFLRGEKFHPMERIFLLQTFFRLPLEKIIITSHFGARLNPFDKHLEHHRGIDMAAPIGTNVLAARAGTILDLGYNEIYGNYILIAHQGDYQSLYAHLKSIKVQLKMEVYSGMIIGEVGVTGKTTGPHLHFEIRKKGEPTDPMSLFRM